MRLERRYRMLVRAFPSGWRRRNGDDLVHTLMDCSKSQQRFPSVGDAVDLVVRGVSLRLQRPGPVLQVVSAVAVFVLTTMAVHFLVTPTPVSFLLTSLVVVLIPGTGVVYSISTAVSSGWRRGSLAVLGCTLGIVPHLLAAAIGLSGVMQAGAELFEIVRWVGVGYLAYLGVGMLRSSGAMVGLEESGSPDSAWPVVRRGVLINVLNPKLTVFFFAFLPQFLRSAPTVVDVRLLGLSGVFMAMTLAVFLIYAAFASAVRERVLAAPGLLRRVEQLLGTALLGFAARLAVVDR